MIIIIIVCATRWSEAEDIGRARGERVAPGASPALMMLQSSGVEWSGVEWSKVEWSGVEQSSSEQSRAEQSRAEQSRAEQSMVLSCGMLKRCQN